MRHKHSSFFRPLSSSALTISIFLLTLPAWTQTYKVLYTFTGPDNLGAGSSIARDNQGNLYGASVFSKQQCGGDDCGAIYKISPSGVETTLHVFKGSPDGQHPNAVIVDATGTLYGTTYYGGTSTYQYCNNLGCGVLFEITTSGKESVLHSFTAPPDDGTLPLAGVIEGSNGALYGTTTNGGAGTLGTDGDGTIYQFANGKEEILYSFQDGADGGFPSAPLLLHDGALYGTSTFGGTGPCFTSNGNGCGTVFKLDASGETPLYEFQNGPDGGFPGAGLIADKSGNLYGTTVLGGDSSCSINPPPTGCGVVFELTPDGHETILHTFTGSTDGAWPSSALVMDEAGNLYGTAYFGGDSTGDNGSGTIFKVDGSGNFSVIHTFEGSDGSFPMAITRSGKTLYGVTNNGGPTNRGVVYELTLQ